MRSAPFGTVGHVIGRALSPRARRCAESGRGCGVRTGTIGVAREGAKGVVDAESGAGAVAGAAGMARWSGRKRSAGEMWCVERWSRSVDRKYALRSSSRSDSYVIIRCYSECAQDAG